MGGWFGVFGLWSLQLAGEGGVEEGFFQGVQSGEFVSFPVKHTVRN